MTLALVSYKAYGIEASEPLQKRFIQRLELKITGANTDATYDFGTYAGTFWTAVGSTAPGINALLAIKQIQTLAKLFEGIGGTGLNGRSIVGTAGNVTYLDSSVYAGGSATPTLTVTGLAVADTILSATQRIKNGNSLPLLGWTDGSRTLNQCVVAYSADPGGTGVVRFAVLKAASTPLTGQALVQMDGTNTLLPNVSFLSGDAPTAADLVLQWELPDSVLPIESAS